MAIDETEVVQNPDEILRFPFTRDEEFSQAWSGPAA
jgi:hypothetical protein